MPRDNTAAVKTVVQSCSQFRRFVRRIENEAQPVALTDLYPFAREYRVFQPGEIKP